jgi:short-subunit dehydrogenase
MNVIITGASKGIGKAIAHSFGALNYSLYLCSRGEKALYKTVEELYNEFPFIQIKAIPADLSTKTGCDSFSQFVLASATSIDILVNNAGWFVSGSVYNEPEGQLEEMINVNLYSAYHVTRALVGKMVEQRSGHVFNMCSIASIAAYDNGGSYSISKYAMYGFGKNLREEMKPFGVKVTNVFPGAVLTDSWAASSIDPKRIMETEDVAKLVVAASQLSPQACVEDIILRPQLGDL